MAKLCRHHQKQFMSVLSHMHSEAGPESALAEHEDMAASSPAPQRQQVRSTGDLLRSRDTFQPCSSFGRGAPTQSSLNCENGTEDKGTPGESLRLTGSEVCAATSADLPVALGGSNSIAGARSSSKGTLTTNCHKMGSLEALQKETVNQKLISNSPLGLSSGDCPPIHSPSRIEETSSCNQKNKTEGAVTARGQKESLQALPVQLLNLRKNLIKNQNGPQAPTGSDHKAVKRAVVHGSPQENAATTKRTVRGNHMLPTATSAKDCWVLSKTRPGGRGASGRLRLKVQSPLIKTARKSNRVTVPRARSSTSTLCQYVNEHDNQCDIVYISKPITECRFDAQRSWSSTRKTARKSTRGHLCNEEYWELKTVRTSARKESFAPFVSNLPAPVTLKPVVTLPVSGIPLAVGTGIHRAEGQGKALLNQNQFQELEESLNLNCLENCAEKVVGVSQTSSVSSVNDSPEGEQKRHTCRPSSPGSENCPAAVDDVRGPNIHGSKFTTVWANPPNQSENMLAVSSSAEPCCEPLEECRITEQTALGQGQISKESDEMKCISSTKGRRSPNHSEPSQNNGSQDHSVPSLDIMEVSPINGVEISLPLWDQNSKENNGSSEMLNGDSEELSHSLCKPTLESQPPECTNKSVENIGKVKGEMLVTDRDEPKESGITLPVPPISVSYPDTSKNDLHPQPSSIDEDKSRCSDPGESTPEVVEEQGLGTDSTESNTELSNLCLTEKKPEDFDANVPDCKREENIRSMRSLKSGINYNKEKRSTPPATEKKKPRKKLIPPTSDRHLRSRQVQPQPMASGGNVKEEPVDSADGLLVPCLSVKFPRNQGEKGYRREVCISKVASVQFPVDCFNKTLLQSIANPESRVDESLATTSAKASGKVKKSVAKHVTSEVVAEERENLEDEELITDSFLCEKNHLKQGRILEVCVDVKSVEERQVSFSVQNAETNRVSDDTSHQQSSSRKTSAHKGSTRRASGGLTKRAASFGSSQQMTKGIIAKVPSGDKKTSIGSRELRYLTMSVNRSETRVLEEDAKCTDKKQSTHLLQREEESDPADMNDANATEVSQPKFLDWCSEDENQELITTLNAKYESLHKAWIQMEKDGTVIQKAKSRSDRLKEIWKSKKRTRRVRGLYDHKVSPVQKLFMANFSLASICKWFMETTETKSLVIVKNVSARNPMEAIKSKTFLQKSSMVGLFPSPQAERLKKHLKKFAIASPARSNPKTRAMLDKVQKMNLVEGELIRQKQQGLLPDAGGGFPRDLFLAKEPGGQVERDGLSSGRTALQLSKHLGLKKPVSAWILRKYSNMMGKLHKFQHGKEKAGRKSPGKHKSICMNPLVSPKPTSQTQLDSPRGLLPAAPRRPEKKKGSRDVTVKDPHLGRGKTSKSEAVSLDTSRSVPKRFPASRKPRADSSSNKQLAPKKAGGSRKSSSLLIKTFPKNVEKRSPGTGLKVVSRAKSRTGPGKEVKGKKVKAKRKGGVGKERLSKPTQKKTGSSAKSRQRNKTGTKIQNKAVTPAKLRPKCDASSEAKHNKKRKPSEKSEPVPNKRKRTDAK